MIFLVGVPLLDHYQIIKRDSSSSLQQSQLVIRPVRSFDLYSSYTSYVLRSTVIVPCKSTSVLHTMYPNRPQGNNNLTQRSIPLVTLVSERGLCGSVAASMFETDAAEVKTWTIISQAKRSGRSRSSPSVSSRLIDDDHKGRFMSSCRS
jgi:hypothetical protein